MRPLNLTAAVVVALTGARQVRRRRIGNPTVAVIVAEPHHDHNHRERGGQSVFAEPGVGRR